MDEQEIISCFSSELQWIKDVDIREKVIQLWKIAAERGNWQTLTQVPFTLLFENSGLLTEHTKRITHLAKSVSDTRDETLNINFLIAGALLHDVGKLMEYELQNGKVIKSEFGKQKRHPVSGSELATEFGLPDEIVHIIYAHSKEGDGLQRSPEAIIIHHCDFIDFEIKRSLVKS